MLISKAHHQAVVRQLESRLADKQAELDRALEGQKGVRTERDRFRDLFVQAMGAKWNEEPIQQIPLQTHTLKPGAVGEFEQMASRWSPAEQAMYECWLKDEGATVEEPERVWMERFGGVSPLEALQ